MTSNLDTLETIADQNDKHVNWNTQGKGGRKRATIVPTTIAPIFIWRNRLACQIANAPKSFPYLSKREE